MKMHKYPSIDQFRTIVKQVRSSASFDGKDENGEPIYDITKKSPILKFTGTVKLHGTNSAICFNFGDYSNYWCQSRERIIDPYTDNAGFATYVYSHKDMYELIFSKIESDMSNTITDIENYSGVAIYGEWCGGNIQKGVGINGLPKMFVVFGLKLISQHDDQANLWVPLTTYSLTNHQINLYSINEFDTFSIDIDFNEPELSQNILINTTISVENECPVAKYFGINGIGEGIVWECIHNGTIYRFKTKGEKHSISKVKVLVPIDIEKVNTIKDCVNNIVTEQRLSQGLSYFRENGVSMDIKNTGKFIKWVNDDIIKEELDVIVGSGLEVKDVLSSASKKSKEWYFNII